MKNRIFLPFFSPAGSFRHAHACHLPPRKAPSDRLRHGKRKMCRFSVPQAPFVTLSRATFLSEEGSWRRTALPQKKSVQTFSFENLNSAFVFSAAQSRKSHRLMAPLCKGSWRGAPEGLTLKRRKPQKFICGCSAAKLLPSEPQHPSVACGDSSPL